MGFSGGISMRWLFTHCIQIKLEFENVGFRGEGKTGVSTYKNLSET